jgi:hypothetical protein
MTPIAEIRQESPSQDGRQRVLNRGVFRPVVYPIRPRETRMDGEYEHHFFRGLKKKGFFAGLIKDLVAEWG